jgi:hypothetical protein
MRVWISLSTIPALGAILLSYPDEDPLVAFPMILPMGWVDNPNYLCALTEMIADLANARFEANDLATQNHPLSTLANSIPAPDPAPPSKLHDGMPPPKTRSQGPLKPPLNFADVYMDDFLSATQLSGKERDAARSTLFECIDQVLRPLAHNDNTCQKEPISVKKLQRGDAAWAT